MQAMNLRAHEGKVMVLHFTDGQVVKARVIHVDVDDRKEIIYDVIEIVELGPRPGAHLKPGATLSAPLSELANVSAA